MKTVSVELANRAFSANFYKVLDTQVEKPFLVIRQLEGNIYREIKIPLDNIVSIEEEILLDNEEE